jgi:hypothetical protein
MAASPLNFSLPSNAVSQTGDISFGDRVNSGLALPAWLPYVLIGAALAVAGWFLLKKRK